MTSKNWVIDYAHRVQKNEIHEEYEKQMARVQVTHDFYNSIIDRLEADQDGVAFSRLKEARDRERAYHLKVQENYRYFECRDEGTRIVSISDGCIG